MANVIIPSGWSLPSNTIEFQYQATIRPVFIESRIGWFSQLSQPVTRPRKVTTHEAMAQPVLTPSTIAIDWFTGLSTPILPRIKASTSTVDFIAVTATPAAVTSIDWFNALSVPVRTKPGLRAALQKAAELDPLPIPPVPSFGWFAQLSKPVLPAIKVSTSTVDFIAATTAPVVTVTVDMWFEALSEPVRRRRFSAAHQQFLAFVKAAPFAETVTEDRWHQAWSEPVRSKIGLRANLQQFLAFSPFPIVQETVTLDKWYQRYSEPVRQKRGLLAMHQQFLALVKAAPFPETVTESRWHQAWSEPVRVKPSLRTGLHQYLAFYPTPILATPINVTMDATETKDTFFGFADLYNTATGANVSIHEIKENRAEVSIIES